MATLPTADLARARKFYEGTLGLSEIPEAAENDMFLYKCGDGMLFVYESAFAGSNKATAVTFMATEEQFDAEVEELRHKGVSFMTFDFEGMEWDGDVATMMGMRAVWFTDPDGNILNISTTPMK
ncbi:MAG TPA: VOC family protein [Candidatus Limnocylindrales bacterium]